MITTPNKESLRQAAGLLATGELIGVPTETVYGLAADATNPDAVRRVFEAKGRPSNNPLILHFATALAAESLVDFGDRAWLRRQWDLASSFWPGPLTVVVPAATPVLRLVTAGLDTVAIRVPSHPVMLRLLELCQFPIAAPSANVSNYVSPTQASHVIDGLGQRVSMVLDGGPCHYGVESTIIKLSASGPVLLRPGGVSDDQLASVFDCKSVLKVSADLGSTEAGSNLQSPGQFPVHYSPATTLRFADQCDAPESVLEPSGSRKVGRIAFRRLDDKQATKFDRIWTVSEHGDLEEIARNLFATLREADQSECDVLLVDRCEEVGIGRAIMDRLHRATARTVHR